jgi:hypothetical protein
VVTTSIWRRVGVFQLLPDHDEEAAFDPSIGPPCPIFGRSLPIPLPLETLFIHHHLLY